MGPMPNSDETLRRPPGDEIAPDAPHPTRSPSVLIVSATDSRFLPFLKGMLASLQPTLARPEVHLACFDIGLDPADHTWLAGQGATIVAPRIQFGLDPADHSTALLSFLARPFLREYFPGYDVYVWIDSDVWLQDQGVIEEYVQGALAEGMAITHERERGYRFQSWLFGWTLKHFVLGYGAANAAYLMGRKHVNAGFFAIRADAPQWAGWARRYEAAIKRTGALVPHDQFALNHALHGDWAGLGGKPQARLLDPRCNWICDRGAPMWNDAEAAFCKPYAPFTTIGALHLAGPAKRKTYDIRRTGGGSFTTYILQGTSPANPILSGPLSSS